MNNSEKTMYSCEESQRKRKESTNHTSITAKKKESSVALEWPEPISLKWLLYNDQADRKEKQKQKQKREKSHMSTHENKQ